MANTDNEEAKKREQLLEFAKEVLIGKTLVQIFDVIFGNYLFHRRNPNDYPEYCIEDVYVQEVDSEEEFCLRLKGWKGPFAIYTRDNRRMDKNTNFKYQIITWLSGWAYNTLMTVDRGYFIKEYIYHPIICLPNYIITAQETYDSPQRSELNDMPISELSNLIRRDKRIISEENYFIDPYYMNTVKRLLKNQKQ